MYIINVTKLSIGGKRFGEKGEILDAGYWMLGTGYSILVTGCW
jgi:hypothetical protein